MLSSNMSIETEYIQHYTVVATFHYGCTGVTPPSESFNDIRGMASSKHVRFIQTKTVLLSTDVREKKERAEKIRRQKSELIQWR